MLDSRRGGIYSFWVYRVGFWLVECLYREVYQDIFFKYYYFLGGWDKVGIIGMIVEML